MSESLDPFAGAGHSIARGNATPKEHPQGEQIHYPADDPARFLQHVVLITALVLGKKKGDLLAPSRAQELARGRHILWTVARFGGGLSFPVIGRLTERDHTTVMSGVARAAALMEREPGYRHAVRRVAETLALGGWRLGAADIPAASIAAIGAQRRQAKTARLYTAPILRVLTGRYVRISEIREHLRAEGVSSTYTGVRDELYRLAAEGRVASWKPLGARPVYWRRA